MSGLACTWVNPMRMPSSRSSSELGGRVVAGHRAGGRRVGRRYWPSVSDVDVASAQIPHAHENFVPLLAHAEDQPALGERRRAAEAARIGQQLERAVIPPAGSGQPVEAFRRLEIVIDDGGLARR